MPELVAALVFAGVVVLVGGLWWAFEGGFRVSDRLAAAGRVGQNLSTDILRTERVQKRSSVVGSELETRLTALIEQAGYRRTAGDLIVVVLAFVLCGGVLTWLRVGGFFSTLLGAALVGSLPIFYLIYKRQRRLQLISQQFPDALDAMARSIRAGNALSSAIQIVGDELPDPIGGEFKQVTEEVRLGLDPTEALAGLTKRAPTEDVGFFCSALRIQRTSGGNLAEILDRLSEVIRERYKIMSHARVLSAQHKWTAIFVGLSPIVFALILQLLSPGYFDPLLKSPVGPLLIGMGLVLEAIGFFMIWRIAKIKV